MIRIEFMVDVPKKTFIAMMQIILLSNISNVYLVKYLR